MSLGAYLTASMTAIRSATTIDPREIQSAPGRKPDEWYGIVEFNVPLDTV